MSEQAREGPALLVWSDAFCTGLAGVDHEHRQLVELINNLYRVMTHDGSGSITEEFLGEIYARISAHFALEDRIMREAGYDQYASHKADHEALLDRLRDIMDDAADDAAYTSRQLGRDLEQWFTVHFRTHDPRLHTHLGDH